VTRKKTIQEKEKIVVQIEPYTAQKPFRAHISSAENCARPQKLSHARVTNDFLSTFLTV
jgi:hypothetical protein